jgi:hypothetical protein
MSLQIRQEIAKEKPAGEPMPATGVKRTPTGAPPAETPPTDPTVQPLYQQAPTPELTHKDLPAWRGIRGMLNWLRYGHHQDNPDYAAYGYVPQRQEKKPWVARKGFGWEEMKCYLGNIPLHEYRKADQYYGVWANFVSDTVIDFVENHYFPALGINELIQEQNIEIKVNNILQQFKHQLTNQIKSYALKAYRQIYGNIKSRLKERLIADYKEKNPQSSNVEAEKEVDKTLDKMGDEGIPVQPPKPAAEPMTMEPEPATPKPTVPTPIEGEEETAHDELMRDIEADLADEDIITGLRDQD